MMQGSKVDGTEHGRTQGLRDERRFLVTKVVVEYNGKGTGADEGDPSGVAAAVPTR